MKIINRILKVFFLLMLIFICYQFSYTYASNEYISNENLTYKELSDGTTLISGFKIGIKVSEITNGYFSSEYAVKIFDDNDNEITTQNDKTIGTGCKVKLYTNSDVLAKTYTIVVYGDTNGDGNINAVDALIVVKNKLELILFENSVVEEAGRINENERKTGDTPSAVDALSIIKYKLNPDEYPINQKLYIKEVPDKDNAIYVSLYDDGTLAFTATDRVLEGKKIVKSYGNIYEKDFGYAGPWADEDDQITRVDIMDKIKPKSINRWFYGLGSLKKIDNMSNLDTSKVTDMNFLFSGCNSLTSLDLSNFNTSNVTNMQFMFYACENLTSLDLSNFNTGSVTNMKGMFYYCSSLMSLDLSNFNTNSITSMYCMFMGCSSLTELNLDSFNTNNVLSMAGLFDGCENLTNLNLSNFDTCNVKSMDEMFEGCKNLTNLDLSNFNTSNVTNMGYMFCGCYNLANLNLSNFNTSNVTDMNNMFASCKSLTTLDLTSFETSKVKKDIGMFYKCENLTTVYVGVGWSYHNIINGKYYLPGSDGCGTDYAIGVQ